MHPLESDDFEEHIFQHRATGYGVGFCGGGGQKKSIEDIVEKTLRELGATEDDLENRLLRPIDLRRAITEAETNFVIRNFDSMDSEVRTSAAQMMKGIAEGLGDTGVMLGYGASDGGTVVRAEPDLRMRVHTWSVTAPEEED